MIGGGGGDGAVYAGLDGTLNAAGYHSGGIVGRDASFMRNVPASLFAGAQRYHSGGLVLGRDERPAIVQTGERVLDRREAAVYDAFLAQRTMGAPAGGQGQGKTVVQMEVNVHNDTDARVTAEESMDANGKPRLDIVVDMLDDALAQKESRGTSKLGSVMSRKYGLNKDKQLYSH